MSVQAVAVWTVTPYCLVADTNILKERASESKFDLHHGGNRFLWNSDIHKQDYSIFNTCRPQSVFLSNISFYKMTAHKNISLMVSVTNKLLFSIPHSNLNFLQPIWFVNTDEHSMFPLSLSCEAKSPSAC
jgi:hypothetical protein